jgi:hypothetical protein
MFQFLGKLTDATAQIGFDEIQFGFDVKGHGTQEQYDEIIKNVQQFSPNYRTIVDNVKVVPVLLI